MNITIIIPAHNAAANLSRPLQSLLEQSYPHWEAIIIDDGSSDQTKQEAEKWKQRDIGVQLGSHLN